MYGEEDRQCFSKLIAVSEKWNGQIPKIAGDGGKHQLIYAGKKVHKAKKIKLDKKKRSNGNKYQTF